MPKGKIKFKSNNLEQRRKKIPIETRLLVLFQSEWLRENIIPDRPATIDESKKADTWAKKMVILTIQEYKWWEKDGKPK